VATAGFPVIRGTSYRKALCNYVVEGSTTVQGLPDTNCRTDMATNHRKESAIGAASEGNKRLGRYPDCPANTHVARPPW